jgi:glycosyl transferase, family 25
MQSGRVKKEHMEASILTDKAVDTVLLSAGGALMSSFDRIRIINLKRRTDRREETSREFLRIGVTIKNDGAIAFFDACEYNEKGPFISAGARGCYQSHLRILKEAAANGVRSVAIFEDDFDFARNASLLVPEARSLLNSSPWSIFYGGHEDFVRRDADTAPVSLTEPGIWIRGAHFIAFNGSVIPALVEYLEHDLFLHSDAGAIGVDGAYHHFRVKNPEFKTYLAWPRLGYQRPSKTDISPPSAFDRLAGIQSLLRAARRVKRSILKYAR